MTLDGAMDGLAVYLIPDFSEALDPQLIISALGQAFFSLSLGVGTMLVYGSYISPRESLSTVGLMVAALDTSFAFLAGLLILPAMYVALASGVEIFDASGALVAGPGLIVAVLPALFDTMGGAGGIISFAFFILMSIAALTSSISMLEVPVAYVVETRGISRHRATLLIGLLITAISLTIVANFGVLFDSVVTLTTEYSQPLLGLFFAVFVGWIWHRHGVLEELKKGHAGVEHTLFWKLWPFYIRYVCPVAILAVYVQLIWF
jgi:NSS family neurotransmitter:Na+ symporter